MREEYEARIRQLEKLVLQSTVVSKDLEEKYEERIRHLEERLTKRETSTASPQHSETRSKGRAEQNTPDHASDTYGGILNSTKTDARSYTRENSAEREGPHMRLPEKVGYGWLHPKDAKRNGYANDASETDTQRWWW